MSAASTEVSSARPLAGKVAVVTGASRGSGLATSRALANAGARVALLARASDHLDEAARSIEGSLALPTDLTNPDDVRRSFATIGSQFGHLNILVNNAAVAVPNRIEDATDEELRLQVDTNYLGAVYCIRSAIPLLRQTEGTIINVSTESATDPFPYLLPYGSTKAALEMLTRALVVELRDDNIAVTLLISGHTKTGGFSARWNPEVRDAAAAEWRRGGYLHRVAGSQPQEPEDVAETVLFVVTRPSRTMADVISCRARR